MPARIRWSIVLTGLNKQLLEAENERKTAESALSGTLAPGALEAQAEATKNLAVAKFKLRPRTPRWPI